MYRVNAGFACHLRNAEVSPEFRMQEFFDARPPGRSRIYFGIRDPRGNGEQFPYQCVDCQGTSMRSGSIFMVEMASQECQFSTYIVVHRFESGFDLSQIVNPRVSNLRSKETSTARGDASAVFSATPVERGTERLPEDRALPVTLLITSCNDQVIVRSLMSVFRNKSLGRVTQLCEGEVPATDLAGNGSIERTPLGERTVPQQGGKNGTEGVSGHTL